MCGRPGELPWRMCFSPCCTRWGRRMWKASGTARESSMWVRGGKGGWGLGIRGWGLVRPFGPVLLLMTYTAFCAGNDARIADAAQKADREAVKALVAQRVDVNASQADGMTALHWAAFHDDTEMAKLLLHAGADVKVAT